MTQLLQAAQTLVLSFIRSAEDGRAAKLNGNTPSSDRLKGQDGSLSDQSLPEGINGSTNVYEGLHNVHANGVANDDSRAACIRRTALVENHGPQKLTQIMDLELPETGAAQDGFLEEVKKVLRCSVNTWDPGFMSKLYASTDAPGLAAELVLASLNTQVHTFQVSPALTIVEKHTTRALANLFGFTGPHAGGITVQGGAASNTTSVVIARNTLYPDTKTHGNSANGLKLLLFTSAHGHYSIEKAALMLGFGSSSVWSVPVDPKTGRMDPSALRSLIAKAQNKGYTPFYLNATAGTTVLGSYDPFPALADICEEHNIWLHIDGSWGGPVIFSLTHNDKLKGSNLANSITINPHKMMGVPVTCSFLFGPDVRQFHRSNTLPANYLFHTSEDSSNVYDLADLTLQCGRKGDALKLYLSWVYHGTDGYRKQVDAALDTTHYLADLVSKHADLVLVSENPPPCCQVCFYYAHRGTLFENSENNSNITKQIVQGLIPRGFMIDYAGGDERGSFLRPVVSRGTGKEIVKALIDAVVELGAKAVTGRTEMGEVRL
ncbi:MAG: hypothetical protein LQ346_003206 [Caloplaca aetnensis]|nr:MAG: hypothetical protein LQ346_003206 [Caloplaca aetnensis]